MSCPIEDYAMIGDCRSGALVNLQGSIDWLCLPRFDSDAIFCALLGDERNGHWTITSGEAYESYRHYRDDTLILETFFKTAHGLVKLIDFMPYDGTDSHIIRIVEGIEGRVPMRFELVPRFDYGTTIPWVHTLKDGRICFVAAPHQLILCSSLANIDERSAVDTSFVIHEGERISFMLSYSPAHLPAPPCLTAEEELYKTESTWKRWSKKCRPAGQWSPHVLRSAITLKGLSYRPTGGIAAALTTSLPESFGGSRNWDYRYCWIRDASFTLAALHQAGYRNEARYWRNWVRRAVAGAPQQLQVLYGLTGERRLNEWTADWLSGYENSTPVRIGNAAAKQFQLDIWGELVDALGIESPAGIELLPQVEHELFDTMNFLESSWRLPDDGIWEIRGERRHFVHSKIMIWLVFQRVGHAVIHSSLHHRQRHWCEVADTIREDVLQKGLDSSGCHLVQSYGQNELDASLLLVIIAGFLPSDDPRVIATVHAVEERLMENGLVRRYETDTGVDGINENEGTFLACSFWLVECYTLIGELDKATSLMTRLTKLTNDVGLLAEEYDTRSNRFAGNFPQAYSHVALINAAYRLEAATHPQ